MARPNTRNISTQHLATLLDRVVRCCEGAGQTRATSCNIQKCCNKNLTIFKLDPTSCNMLLQGSQTRVTMQQCQLQDNVLKGYVRLAGPLGVELRQGTHTHFKKANVFVYLY